jgi:hypothetical protein
MTVAADADGSGHGVRKRDPARRTAGAARRPTAALAAVLIVLGAAGGRARATDEERGHEHDHGHEQEGQEVDGPAGEQREGEQDEQEGRQGSEDGCALESHASWSVTTPLARLGRHIRGRTAG